MTYAMRCGAAGAGSVGPEMSPDVVIAVAGLFVALGGFVQSGIGLGLGLVAAPVVTLLDPALMPGSMLVAGASLPVLILAREALHTDWPGVSWALTGRVAGTLGGIWVLAVVSLRALGIVVGGMVLTVVVLSVRSAVVPRNRATLLTAGVISGVTGHGHVDRRPAGGAAVPDRERPPGPGDPVGVLHRGEQPSRWARSPPPGTCPAAT